MVKATESGSGLERKTVSSSRHIAAKGKTLCIMLQKESYLSGSLTRLWKTGSCAYSETSVFTQVLFCNATLLSLPFHMLIIENDGNMRKDLCAKKLELIY